jgi:hypothetical protein
MFFLSQHSEEMAQNYNIWLGLKFKNPDKIAVVKQNIFSKPKTKLRPQV